MFVLKFEVRVVINEGSHVLGQLHGLILLFHLRALQHMVLLEKLLDLPLVLQDQLFILLDLLLVATTHAFILLLLVHVGLFVQSQLLAHQLDLSVVIMFHLIHLVLVLLVDALNLRLLLSGCLLLLAVVIRLHLLDLEVELVLERLVLDCQILFLRRHLFKLLLEYLQVSRLLIKLDYKAVVLLEGSSQVLFSVLELLNLANLLHILQCFRFLDLLLIFLLDLLASVLNLNFRLLLQQNHFILKSDKLLPVGLSQLLEVVLLLDQDLAHALLAG